MNNIKRSLLFAGAAAMLAAASLTGFGQSVDTDATTATSGTTAKKPMYRPPSKAKTKSSSDVWNGGYVGGYVGVGLSRDRGETSPAFSSTGYFALTSTGAIATAGRQSLSKTRFSGGGTFGYNHQSGSWVVGVEADFGIQTGATSATTTATYPCCAPTSFTVTQTDKQRWLLTARPRVGYAWGNTMAYITGGLAVTRINYTEHFTDTFATANETGGSNNTKAGWTGGGGFETKVNDRWSIKGEYLYADFRRTTTTSTNLTAFTPPIAFPTNVFTHSIFAKEHILRFGFNYHF